MKKPIVAITMGDPGGIGPEVIARAIQDLKRFKDVFLLLIGARVVFEFLEEELHLQLPLNPILTLTRDCLRDDSVNFLDVTEEAGWLLKNRSLAKASSDALFDIGRVSVTNAAMSLAALKAGAYQAATGLVDALVTGPVSKEAVRLVEPRFHGHTEYLAKVAQVKKFAMMFLNDPITCLSPPRGDFFRNTSTRFFNEARACQTGDRDEDGPGSAAFRVTLVTIHVPLKKVSRLLTEEAILEKIQLTDEFLKTRLGISKPKIAVSALNPHGRETGEEEVKVIEPAIREAREEKINVFGPISGDRVFYDAYHGTYDAVVAMYHDQALAPFKLIAFDTGVNLTLGLPYLRTSPDHGTAFDIAYQGKADSRSMESALRCALRLLRPAVPRRDSQ